MMILRGKEEEVDDRKEKKQEEHINEDEEWEDEEENVDNDMDMDVSLVELSNKSLVLKNPSVFYRCVIISFNVIFKLKSES